MCVCPAREVNVVIQQLVSHGEGGKSLSFSWGNSQDDRQIAQAKARTAQSVELGYWMHAAPCFVVGNEPCPIDDGVVRFQRCIGRSKCLIGISLPRERVKAVQADLHTSWLFC